MRILEFRVEGQRLRKSDSCDFSGIAPGTIGYLKLHFIFDGDWYDCNKICIFDTLTKSVPVKIENGYCLVPEEISKSSSFSVSLVGKGVKKDYLIRTNKELIGEDL